MQTPKKPKQKRKTYWCLSGVHSDPPRVRKDEMFCKACLSRIREDDMPGCKG